jgi:hypothetical protein
MIPLQAFEAFPIPLAAGVDEIAKLTSVRGHCCSCITSS